MTELQLKIRRLVHSVSAARKRGKPCENKEMALAELRAEQKKVQAEAKAAKKAAKQNPAGV